MPAVAQRVAIVDIGTNTTRLLIADVDGRAVAEVDRRTEITKLGEGVDESGRLADAAMDRVRSVLSAYREAIAGASVTATAGVMTSATRDAVNGPQFVDEVRREYGVDARAIDGDTEARLSFLGATSGRPPSPDPLLVLDIGGGSTEFVVGAGNEVTFRVSTQAGAVRQTERHLHDDPPAHAQLEALAADVRAIVAASVPEAVRRGVRAGVAVAGTATTCAAIAQSLEPYDPARVHGYPLQKAECELMLAELAQMPLARRERVAGLHPKRAPVIVAGIVILLEALRAFGLDEIEVSEHDILYGAAIDLAASLNASV